MRKRQLFYSTLLEMVMRYMKTLRTNKTGKSNFARRTYASIPSQCKVLKTSRHHDVFKCSLVKCSFWQEMYLTLQLLKGDVVYSNNT